MSNTKEIPTDGYIFPKWKQKGYRATALAYMQREKVNFIEHTNGELYSIEEIKKAMIS